jgi:Ca2+-binding EF-hand superfamily protein
MRAEALDRVQLIFNLFDVDDSGYLEAADFELMASRVVQAAPDSSKAEQKAAVAAFRRYWATLSEELDANHDGRISSDEFTACVLSPERFDDTISYFADTYTALGDPDGDGLVDRDRYIALMLAVGFELANTNALFEAFEPNDADQIKVSTWVAAIRDFYHPEKAGTAVDYLVAIPTV